MLLPSSALDRLSRMNISYPLLFSAENVADGMRSHCGVLEFTAEEGRVYLPGWMMRTLGVGAGDLVRFENVSLPLGTFAKIQPQQNEFLDIADPKAV